jgi:cytosine deaminase
VDLTIRNARFAGGDALVDIGIMRGRIIAIEHNLAADAVAYDAHGLLACPGLIEAHIHLDKSRSIDPASGVALVKKDMTVENIHARAAQTLEQCILQGCTRMRTQVEIDPDIGLRGFEAVQTLIDEYKWAIDIELCVFPDEGLVSSPDTDALLVECLRRGVKVIGGVPHADKNSAAQIRRIFALAREYDVDIDMHLDVGPSAAHMDIHLICELTDQYKRGGRVVAGHMAKLSLLPPDKLAEIARRLAASGIGVTVLPASDLFLMGRDQDYSVRRGVADAHLLSAHGVNCALSTDSVLNPSTPYGDCSLLRIANLYANLMFLDSAAELRQCFEMLTNRSARLLNLAEYGFAVGNPADIVLINARTPEQAVMEIARPMAAFKRGRQTMLRHPPALVRPSLLP